jgi:DNA processing protein
MESIAAKQAPMRKAPRSAETPYVPPNEVATSTLGELIFGTRSIPEHQQERMGFKGEGSGPKVWLAGDVSLIRRPCVSVVGAREVSKDGAARTRRLAKELAQAGIVTVSGLAKGVDTEALTQAMSAGGRVIAVIGTPIDRAYPAENKRLQEEIYRDHLLISQFAPGKRVFPSNFPERNQLMAAITDATVIVEASDTSGSLHQAAECSRLGRWLFIAKSLAENPSLTWPHKFLAYPTTRVLTQFSDITDVIRVN